MPETYTVQFVLLGGCILITSNLHKKNMQIGNYFIEIILLKAFNTISPLSSN